MAFVRGFSVCAREGEEEMSELLFAWFLVVSELGGDGGHFEDADDPVSLSGVPTLKRLQARARSRLCNPAHLSPCHA